MGTILIGFSIGFVDKTLNFCNEFDLFGYRLNCAVIINFKVYDKPIIKNDFTVFQIYGF